MDRLHFYRLNLFGVAQEKKETCLTFLKDTGRGYICNFKGGLVYF